MGGVRRFVDDLLRQRRPRRFRAEPADAAELRAAMALRAAGPDRGGADPDFVEQLHQRLARELAEPAAEAVPPGRSRRRFVQIGSVAAASAAVGVTVDRLWVDGARPAESPPVAAGSQVVPDAGEWQVVMAAKDLPEGGVHPFDLSGIVGFVQRTGGQVRAVSGTCTHLGCKLVLDRPARQLNCPCHNAAFAVDGAVLRHRLPIALPPLPTVLVREFSGDVQVFVPVPTA